MLLKTRVVTPFSTDASHIAPAGNKNIGLAKWIGATSDSDFLPHTGAGYFTLAAIPPCQWDAYSSMFEQVQFRGVKIEWTPVAPTPPPQNILPAGTVQAPFAIAPVMQAFDADSAELEDYGALLTRATTRTGGFGPPTGGSARGKGLSMYLCPRTLGSESGVSGIKISKKRQWFDLQNASIQTIPFYGLKWYLETQGSGQAYQSAIFTYYLAFRGPLGCSQIGELQKAKLAAADAQAAIDITLPAGRA